MTEWFETTQGTWDALWATLARGVADADHPARRPTFATVSSDGWPEARTIVLRSADPQAAEITVHTDLFSDKIKSLTKTPRAALHVWDESQQLQIRLQTEVSIQSGAKTSALWDKIPDHAQQSYGVTPSPGTVIDGALGYLKEPDPATFALLICRVMHVDAVHLGAVHRRVSFSRARHWDGQWLSP
ncbi:pyridoxamine 5'-phosphate oxidase family protein [Loktanella sp. Alg231-35]|uniref:pyridoxamine 5'-phosphate oxidase family protein n=1 Tax=Loktanella sp. Alg231-35 TaxID=1922220 RepID=UPI000D55CD56|nr:pyridoxamine 5'-phosphate oxidase family protein [Loktanella sp. Alg231-35]